MYLSSVSRVAWALVLWLPCCVAQSQWTRTIIHPNNLYESFGYGGSGTSICGETIDNFVNFGHHAAYWNSDTYGYADLNPLGTVYSKAYGTDGATVVGEYILPESDPRRMAVLWQVPQRTFQNLHPFGLDNSTAFAVQGNQQVGWTSVYSVGPQHAALWTGTADSHIDLHPLGANGSKAFAVCNGVQGGNVDSHATLWFGSAASRLDIHPAGMYYSAVRGLDPVQQVGYYLPTSNNTPLACMWTGTAQSMVSLHPAPATESFAYATCFGYQVGWVRLNGSQRPCIWEGSASSYSVLPNVGYGVAYAISSDGVTMTVVGESSIVSGGYTGATVWKRPNPVRTFSGSVVLSDFVGDLTSTTLGVEEFMEGRVIESHSNVPLNSTGTFSIQTRALGILEVRLRCRSFLKRAIPQVLFSNLGASTPAIELINGDIDQDNEVGPGDFGLLSASYGAVVGELNWFENADLDGDGEVGPSDFGILSANFGLVGD